MTTPEYTIKEITPEEHEAELRQELGGSGLFKAVSDRCDNINDECNVLGYMTKGYIQEQLIDILDLIRLYEAEDYDDGK